MTSMKAAKTFALFAGLAMTTPGGIRNLPAATAGDTVTLRTQVDRPVLVADNRGETVVIQIEIEGCEGRALERNPVNLAVVLDRSGSMTGRKLEQAKQAAHLLVDQLEGDDVFSLVMYDTEVDVLVPASRLGEKKRDIQRKIDRIQAGGSTALYDGVRTGGNQLREFLEKNRINRVLLLSDGIANVGPSSNREIANLGQKLAREDISVTTIGLGDDYNEDLMTALAEASDANYYYVADVEELPRVFQDELGELKSVVARDIEIRIECPVGIKPVRILGRPEPIETGTPEVAFGTLAGGQSRIVFLECLIEPGAKGKVSEIADITVRFSGAGEEDGEGSVRRQVAVAYTSDAGEAEEKINRGVVADAAIYANAAETDKAIALSDQGDIEAVRNQLKAQATRLRQVMAEAPEDRRDALFEEIQSVEEVEKNLEGDGFSPSQRKFLQNQAYQRKNAK